MFKLGAHTYYTIALYVIVSKMCFTMFGILPVCTNGTINAIISVVIFQDLTSGIGYLSFNFENGVLNVPVSVHVSYLYE